VKYPKVEFKNIEKDNRISINEREQKRNYNVIIIDTTNIGLLLLLLLLYD